MGRRAPAGAILVTCIAGSLDCIGNAAIANRSVAFNQQINAITPSDREHTAFLYAHTLLAKPTLQERSTGGMKGMLSKSRLAEIPFLNPPHSLVKNFHHFFERFQALCESSVRAAGDAEALFNTLTHRAFAGQL
jgi:type I restriction enzyme S subunit